MQGADLILSSGTNGAPRYLRVLCGNRGAIHQTATWHVDCSFVAMRIRKEQMETGSLNVSR